MYFAYTYAIVMGRPAPADTPFWPTLTFDAALFLAFALHHSVFARERIRDAVSRVVPSGLERSVYVWVASLLLVAVCYLWQPLPGTTWHLEGAPAWLFRGAQLAGIWLTLRSAASIDALDLAGVRQVEASSPTRPIEFTVRGPYGWVRHPIYAGWFLMVLAEPTMTATRLLFAVLSCVYLLAAIPLEEASLRATTSGAYEDYIRKVRWKLIPGVY
jgi:protein-S-isoprenylcysteine O-methyltransferase Ste14